jgi:hypothetical protein
MTETLLFNVNDPRLYASERTYIKTLSQNLINRTTLQAESRRDHTMAIADPRALEAAHHKLSRGDL